MNDILGLGYTGLKQISVASDCKSIRYNGCTRITNALPFSNKEEIKHTMLTFNYISDLYQLITVITLRNVRL